MCVCLTYKGNEEYIKRVSKRLPTRGLILEKVYGSAFLVLVQVPATQTYWPAVQHNAQVHHLGQTVTAQQHKELVYSLNKESCCMQVTYLQSA